MPDGTFNSICHGCRYKVTANNRGTDWKRFTTSISRIRRLGQYQRRTLQENIKEDVQGTRLHPPTQAVTYNLDIASLNNSLGVTQNNCGMMTTNKQPGKEQAHSAKRFHPRTRSGKVAKSLGLQLQRHRQTPRMKRISTVFVMPGTFVVPTVKTMQEQQAPHRWICKSR